MKLTCLAVASALAVVPLLAQNVVSAKAGLVNLAEGEVFLNDVKMAPKIAEFPDIKQNGVLKTAEGRAEVLLSPGSFLRLGEQSSIKMISTALTDVKVEVVGGSAMLEVDEIAKYTPITIVLQNATIQIRKAGLYRFDSDPYDVRVYEGEATVQVGDQVFTLKPSKSVTALNGQWVMQKFDPELGDELFRWSRQRAAAMAAANVSAARMARIGDLNSGYMPVSGWYGMGMPMGWSGGNWIYNPFFGNWTYVPANGFVNSPWGYGYGYWSPVTVVNAYYPSYGGGNTGSLFSRGNTNGRSASTGYSSSYNSGLGYATTDSRGYSGSYNTVNSTGNSTSVSSGTTGSIGSGASGASGHVGGSAGGGASSGGGRGH